MSREARAAVIRAKGQPEMVGNAPQHLRVQHAVGGQRAREAIVDRRQLGKVPYDESGLAPAL
jgi:hypothetical protein